MYLATNLHYVEYYFCLCNVFVWFFLYGTLTQLHIMASLYGAS